MIPGALQPLPQILSPLLNLTDVVTHTMTVSPSLATPRLPPLLMLIISTSHGTLSNAFSRSISAMHGSFLCAKYFLQQTHYKNLICGIFTWTEPKLHIIYLHYLSHSCFYNFSLEYFHCMLQ